MQTARIKAPERMTIEELNIEIRLNQFKLEQALQSNRYKTAAKISESMAKICKLALKRRGF